ncbi:MAG: oligoendopeptidase F, partial [Planctomycetaceae bacterium]|nr:oligoendopeptidase F [Planctomycetaceae bacterium]
MSHPLNWDLKTILPAPGTSDFSSIWETYRTSLQELADRSDSLPSLADSSGTDAWGKFLADYERSETTACDLYSGIGCYAADDAENVQIQQLEAAMSALDPLRERIAANVEFAFQQIDAAGFDAWLASSPQMRRIEYFLRLRRRNAQFRLPKEQELLAADLGVDGIHAWGRLFDRLSGSLKVKVMERGEIVEKSPGQIRFDVPDR